VNGRSADVVQLQDMALGCEDGVFPVMCFLLGNIVLGTCIHCSLIRYVQGRLTVYVGTGSFFRGRSPGIVSYMFPTMVVVYMHTMYTN
jgi:hypothetical protein